jgi:hypothetical protein
MAEKIATFQVDLDGRPVDILIHAMGRIEELAHDLGHESAARQMAELHSADLQRKLDRTLRPTLDAALYQTIVRSVTKVGEESPVETCSRLLNVDLETARGILDGCFT